MSYNLENCYRILDLHSGASLDDVKEAYRTLVKVWHPDRFAGDPAMSSKAGEKLKEINFAYEQICGAETFEYRKVEADYANRTPETTEPPSDSDMNVPPPLITPAPATPISPAAPKRHGCLLIWLVLMLLADALNILLILISPVINTAMGKLNSQMKDMNAHQTPLWANLIILAFVLVDVVAVVNIFKWRKWAFFASVGASVLIFVVYVASGSGLFDAVVCLISPAVLYGVLQIGGQNSGWRRLQ